MTLFYVTCTFFLHFYCYGMRSVMLQINEYDDDDNDDNHCYTVANLCASSNVVADKLENTLDCLYFFCRHLSVVRKKAQGMK